MNDVLHECFTDALNSLGVSYSRYINLPFHIRKTSLSFDVHKLVAESLENANIDQIDFSTIEIYDLSEDEIDSHLRILNASFVLTCLGHRAYVKRLVSYLDFPEARWKIKIDYLLKLLLGKKNIEINIPSYKESLKYQDSFVRNKFYYNIPQFSEELLGRHSDKKDYYEYLNFFSEDHLHLSNEALTIGKWMYPTLDEIRCAEFFYLNSYSRLSNKFSDLHLFISWFDESIDNSKVIFINTITETVKDVFQSLNINKKSEFWLPILNEKTIKPLTSIFFFKIIANEDNSQQLAGQFVDKFIESDLKASYFKAFSDIYQCKYEPESIVRISRLLRLSAELSDNTRSKLNKLTPVLNSCITNYVSNVYISELESLKLIEQGNKKGKLKLFNAFKYRFSKNTRVFNLLSKLDKVNIESVSEFSIKVRILLSSRKEFNSSFLLGKNPLSRDLQDYYKKIFKSWMD